jgi:hypothetical protein
MHSGLCRAPRPGDEIGTWSREALAIRDHAGHRTHRLLFGRS